MLPYLFVLNKIFGELMSENAGRLGGAVLTLGRQGARVRSSQAWVARA